MSEAHDAEIAALHVELAEHKHQLKVRALREQIAEHQAQLAPPVRQWHRIEFLSAGQPVVSGEMHPETRTFKTTGEWYPQAQCGEGYLVVEDGEVVAVVDCDGKALPHGQPSPEYRVRTILTTDPFQA